MNAYENPYPGVNAHLNSVLQTPGVPEQPSVWPGFHSQHIGDIVKALNRQLAASFPNRYVAIAEQSLQTRELEVFFGSPPLHKTKPDVTVFERTRAQSQPSALSTNAPLWQAPLVEVLEPVKEPFAVVVREVVDQRRFGRIVTRLELLSPPNKPGGANYAAYVSKRVHALESDVPLIEIDYLHESPSLILQLPPYPADPRSTAYSIIVSDPRPDWEKGYVRVYGFGVGEPIKIFPLPLTGADILEFDLNPAYHDTYLDVPWNLILDYTAVPERFDTYRADDQARIRAIMAKING